MTAFRVRIFHWSESEPVIDVSGRGDEWRGWPVLRARALDEVYSVRIDGALACLEDGAADSVERAVDGLCTIVKFGDTLQLRETFRLVVERA